MKLFGKVPSQPVPEIVVIPRGEENIVFTCRAVLDYTDFDNLCPEPQALKRVFPGGAVELDTSSQEYSSRLNAWGKRRTAWLFIKSLEATEGLTWDTVDLATPDTWENYSKELQEASFTTAEINCIFDGVITANSLNDAKVKEAKERFLRSQAELQRK